MTCILFSACLYESTGSYCFHPDVGMGISFKFYDSVIGKALSEELSCRGWGISK